MAEIVWTSPAFSQIEALPAAAAFEIVRRVDVLEAFPEMGAPVRTRSSSIRSSIRFNRQSPARCC